MSDALMVNLGSADWPEKKKWSWPWLIPVPLSNVSAPEVFTIDIEYNKRLDRQRPCLEGDFTAGSNL